MEAKNRGLILEPIQPEDFVLGSDRTLSKKFSGRTVISDGDWSKYMENEPQAPVYETNSCASFGTCTALEALKKFLYKHEPDFSDRWVAKGSGTDPLRGNTPKAPAEYLRKNWTVFEHEWPASAAKTVEEFFAELPSNLKTLAIGRGAEWDFGYEYIPTSVHGIRAALLMGTAAMSVPAWFKDENGQYFRPQGVNDTHWVAIQRVNKDGTILIKDTYEPYDKVMRADFSPQVAMGYYLNRQIKQDSAWAQFLAWLHKLVFTNEDDKSLLTIDHSSTIPPAPTAAERIVAEANKWLGKDPTPEDKISDEVACVISLCKVIQPVIDMGEHTYTPLFKADLDRDTRWKRVLTPSPGTIIVSPTRGQNTGHCGIFLTANRIASNNSFGGVKGLWTDNYSYQGWLRYFEQNKGLPTYLYAPSFPNRDA